MVVYVLVLGFSFQCPYWSKLKVTSLHSLLPTKKEKNFDLLKQKSETQQSKSDRSQNIMEKYSIPNNNKKNENNTWENISL